MNEENGAMSYLELEKEVLQQYVRRFLLHPCDDWAREAIRNRYVVELPAEATRFDALQAMAAAMGEEL